MPSRNTLHHAFPGARSADILTSALRNVLALIKGVTVASSATPVVHDHSSTMLVHARSNTWSRAARRGKLPEIVCAGQELPVLRCSVECRERSSFHTSNDIACELLFTWVEGKDRLIFESFASHVSRKVISTLQESGDIIWFSISAVRILWFCIQRLHLHPRFLLSLPCSLIIFHFPSITFWSSPSIMCS